MKGTVAIIACSLLLATGSSPEAASENSAKDAFNPVYIACWFGPVDTDFCGTSYDAAYRGNTPMSVMGNDICSIRRPSGNQHTTFEVAHIGHGGGGSQGWDTFRISCHFPEAPIADQLIPDDAMTPADLVAKNYCGNLKPKASQTYRVWAADHRGGSGLGHLMLHCYADNGM